MRSAGKLLACCTAGVMLAACGGDKKGNPGAPTGRDISYTGSTTMLTITQSNVSSLTTTATSNVSDSAATSGGPSYTGAVSVDGSAALERVLATVRKVRSDPALSFAGAVSTATQTCDGGGSIMMTASIATQGQLTTGDYMAMTFAGCVDAYGEKTNGSIRIDVTASDGADFTKGTAYMTPGYSYGMALTVTDFSSENASGWIGMEGDMESTQVWNSSTYRLENSVQGSSVVVAAGTGDTVTAASAILPLTQGGRFSMKEVEEYTSLSALNATESELNAKLCSIELNGCINFSTAAAVRQLVSSAYPEAGDVTVSDGAGHFIEIIYKASGNVTVKWDVGAGTVTCNTTWADISAGISCLP